MTGTTRISHPEAFGLTTIHDPENQLASNSRLINSKIIDGRVATALSPLKYDPDASSETLTYVLYGEPLQVLGETGPWQLVISVIDGYLGWVEQNAVESLSSDPTHRVSVPMAHIYSDCALKSQPSGTLPLGAYLNVSGSEQNGFMPLASGGWVYAKHIDVIGNYANDPLAIAETFIGTPYLWGGRSRYGIDCSALVQVPLAACGHRVHRDSGPQFESLGRSLAEGESPMRGDLAFFPGHVGWMLDSVHMLHANATHMSVTVDTVEEVTSWVAADLGDSSDKEPFSGYKRILA